jgi:hypothetical protein
VRHGHHAKAMHAVARSPRTRLWPEPEFGFACGTTATKGQCRVMLGGAGLTKGAARRGGGGVGDGNDVPAMLAALVDGGDRR